MLEFRDRKTKRRVEVFMSGRHVGDLAQDMGKWVLYYISSYPVLDANYLRQIAEKLDELNGVTGHV